MAVTVTIKTDTFTLERSNNRGYDEATRMARALGELITSLDKMGIRSQGTKFIDILAPLIGIDLVPTPKEDRDEQLRALMADGPRQISELMQVTGLNRTTLTRALHRGHFANIRHGWWAMPEEPAA